MRFLLAAVSPFLLGGCVIVGDFAGSDRYQTDFHYSYPVRAGARVSVESFNGSIEIAGWDEDRVEIDGAKSGSSVELRDAVRIEIHNTEGAIEIRTVKPSGRMGSAGARYKISVPAGALLDRITTTNAGIRVRDVASAAHLKSTNGSIRVEKVHGDVEARTSNSSIELTRVDGAAVVKTTNGRVVLENVGGCDAETSNNSITVRLERAPAGPIRMNTSNGAIDLKMEQAPRSDIRAETRNSGISVHLPAGTGARVKADTSNSSVSSDFEVVTSGDGGGKNRLEGTIGGGGPTIDLSASNGRIRIVRGSGEAGAQ